MIQKKGLKQCTGCGYLNVEPIVSPALACCPDSNYVDVSTCSSNERKFLDEIKENFIYDGYALVHCQDGDCVLHKAYFESNLSELVEEE